jgi:hypothetical protein
MYSGYGDISGFGSSGDGRGSGDGGRGKKDFYLIRESVIREGADAVNLRSRDTAIRNRIEDVNNQAADLEDREFILQHQLNQLMDAVPHYDTLSSIDQASFNNRSRRYERARVRFNAEVTTVNTAVDDVNRTVYNHNQRVQTHMSRLRDSINVVNEISQDDCPERVKQLPSLAEIL